MCFSVILSRLLYLILVHSGEYLKNLHAQFRWEQTDFLRGDGLEISTTQRMQEL